MRMMLSSFWSWWFMMWRVGPSILPWSSCAHHLIRLIVFCWSRASNFYVGWTGWGGVESPLKAELPGQHVYCSYRPGYVLDWRQERSQSTSVLLLGLMLLAHSSTVRGVSGITPFGIAWVERSVPVHGSLFTIPILGIPASKGWAEWKKNWAKWLVLLATWREMKERGRSCAFVVKAQKLLQLGSLVQSLTTSLLWWSQGRVLAFKIISKCGFWKACLFRHSSLAEFQGTHSSWMFVWRYQHLTQWRTSILSAFGLIVMESKVEAIPVTGVAVLLRHSSSLCLRCCVLWFCNQICILDRGLLASMASHSLGFFLGQCLGMGSTSCYFIGISFGGTAISS